MSDGNADAPSAEAAPRYYGHDEGIPDEPLLTLAAVERRYIAYVLARVANNRSEAARILGVDRQTLHRKLKRLKGALVEPTPSRANDVHASGVPEAAPTRAASSGSTRRRTATTGRDRSRSPSPPANESATTAEPIVSATTREQSGEIAVEPIVERRVEIDGDGRVVAEDSTILAARDLEGPAADLPDLQRLASEPDGPPTPVAT